MACCHLMARIRSHTALVPAAISTPSGTTLVTSSPRRSPMTAVIEIPSGRVALQTEGLVVGAWRAGGAPAAGLGAQTVSTCGAWTPASRLGGGGPVRLARAATIDRGCAVRRPSRPPPLTPSGFNFHGGADCSSGLARAEQRCRRGLSRFDSPRLSAGVGGRRSDRHGQPLLGVVSCIGDLGHRGQSVTQVFSTLACSCRGHLSIRTRRRSGVDAQYRRSGTRSSLSTGMPVAVVVDYSGSTGPVCPATHLTAQRLRQIPSAAVRSGPAAGSLRTAGRFRVIGRAWRNRWRCPRSSPRCAHVSARCRGLS